MSAKITSVRFRVLMLAYIGGACVSYAQASETVGREKVQIHSAQKPASPILPDSNVGKIVSKYMGYEVNIFLRDVCKIDDREKNKTMIKHTLPLKDQAEKELVASEKFKTISDASEWLNTVKANMKSYFTSDIRLNGCNFDAIKKESEKLLEAG